LKQKKNVPAIERDPYQCCPPIGWTMKITDIGYPRKVQQSQKKYRICNIVPAKMYLT
jgi:hypothetical protein